ncbi:hypothetical protein, partial [Pseudomonas amygdali]|uniref:hypothetical protein n=1 Tax=Pseudomonas amygdali TaxID=47877 RepID=UPI001F4571FF
PDRAGKTRACLTAGPNQPEHKKTDTPPPGLIDDSIDFNRITLARFFCPAFGSCSMRPPDNLKTFELYVR